MILWHIGVTMVVIWFVMRGNPRVDYRVVAMASLLPDLVDKPLGRVFFRDHFETGRLYGHTLLLNVALFCVLFFMRGRSKRQFVLVPISSLMHLAADGVWSQPSVFWWPLFGTAFPRDPVSGGALGFLTNPLTNRATIAQEAAGIVLLLWLLGSHGMLSRAGLQKFLRTGMLEPPIEKETSE